MKNIKTQKALLSGHSTDSKNMSLRDTGHCNKLIISRKKVAKTEKSGA